MYLIYLLLAILAGAGLPVQLGMNNQLRIMTGSPMSAAFISFLVGALTLGVYVVLLRQPLPSPLQIATAPWWVWLGGVVGVIYIVVAIVVAPKIGPAVLFSLVVAGQMLNSLIIDQFGLFGFEVHHISPLRVLGVALLVGGVVLIRAF
ncbi:MAG: DMT family transporter [Candidatus Eremiobacteraeota bacterium]|nr:DMT family transporter [Candidatus Eremiobacteraeota bacterium]